jgi:tRNA pseudouridine55 synthase
MGLLFVDKPAGISSHDVVSTVRRAARTRRVGHAGTLDPFATGLLVVAVGSATRLLPYLAAEPKVYDAVIQFGVETNTDDGTGEPVRHAAVPQLTAPSIDTATRTLTGTFAQVPPAFSAKHVNGQRAYAVARRGGTVELSPVEVTVHQWQVLTVHGDRVTVRITCAGGTYVRALARDLGRAMHSAAHCAELRRVASGEAVIGDAVTFAALLPGSIADGDVALKSPLEYLEPMARERLDASAISALSHGRAVPASQPGARAVLLRGDEIVGVAQRVRDAGELTDRWQPSVGLLGPES